MAFRSHLPYRSGLRAVVLDWAGTTVDFGSFAPTAVFIRLFERHGVPITAAQARQGMGLMKKDHLRTILAQEEVRARWQSVHQRVADEEAIEAMFADFEPMQIECIADYAEPIPGLHEAVAFIRDHGWKIGTTTGYTRPMMEALLPAAQSHGYTPDAWVTPSDVPAGRPYPWMCYELAMRLQVFPMSALVKVGDTLPDIAEGLNAGMWTVGLALSGNMLGLTLDEFAALSPAEVSERHVEILQRFDTAGAHFVVDTIIDLPKVLDTIDALVRANERP
jgi:phosphonoacetaldehyde hydrolase